MSEAATGALKLWGVSVSYYTGKIEAYLRYKRIPYEMDNPFAHAREVKAKAGAVQVPIIERPDGRWMSDSTPIILAFEAERPERGVLPDDPVVGFIAALIEDYGDEWLWRPAMHYRWSYDHDRELLSRILADEVSNHLKAPRFMRRRLLKKRQQTLWVLNDGVSEATWDHVESSYRAALGNMTAMLEQRPFLLGDTPSLADFGMMGPMLRHFGQDPTPAEIMRNEAPLVWEWVARLWNAGRLEQPKRLLAHVPEDAQGLLTEIAQTHLVQLAANARAYDAGDEAFEMTVQGCRYINLPVSRYRVHCLERLREQYGTLSDAAQAQLRSLLPEATVLWDTAVPARSGYDEARQAPYNRAINVYDPPPSGKKSSR